ncbi:spore germination protein [Paenibacillus sp. N1-5-1-14]|uniref:spore germination protein n=1 Tax=Paenibacillus radicibacter TaxID=2972488 RepID=UPI0021595018|nr:spore germination protein [Paenibacillus radicibacter]MCR8644693.1 spore germination protein [Paenibacillus radicibacter]
MTGISAQLEDNVTQLKNRLTKTPDLIVKWIGDDKPVYVIAYIACLTDMNAINNNVFDPLQKGLEKKQSLFIGIGEHRAVKDWQEIEKSILHGNSVMFVADKSEAYVLGTKGWPQRSIEDPQLEASLKGAHQGFIETASQNIALIRRYIPNRQLKIEELTVGERSETKVSILYLEDVANPEILERLKQRINDVDVDAIINSGELAEFIEDASYSPFPQLILTERPDSASSQILQGRFVVIVDRSPSVIIGPTSFISYFQSVDDYSMRWLSSSFIRLLRMFAFFLGLFLPAIYISFISYNFEVIPIQLILSIAETRSRVPFHPFLEALIMELTLEMLREAGIRLPSPIGQTVGLVGGIVIGQTAVQTGLVSNIMVIVVASTAIATFIIPNYDMGTAVRLLRFPMMIVAYFFGIIGIIVGAMIIFGHLCSLQSLGTSYGSPFAPVHFRDWKDTIIRVPLKMMIRRPRGSQPLQEVKQRRRKGDSN